MEAQQIIKQIKRIPMLLLAFIVIQFILNFSACLESVGKHKILDVSVNNLKVRTYKNVDLGENHFTTGYDGKLIWKVKNLKEAFLINLGDLYGTISFIKLFYLLILNGAIFWMTTTLKEDTIFSEKLTDGLKIILFVIILYPFLDLLIYNVSKMCIEDLTNGQFTNQYRNKSIFNYLLVMFSILFIPPFIIKAKNLQEAQDLTI